MIFGFLVFVVFLLVWVGLDWLGFVVIFIVLMFVIVGFMLVIWCVYEVVVLCLDLFYNGFVVGWVIDID